MLPMNNPPVGAICAYAGGVAPDKQDPELPHPILETQGWMLCDGRYLRVAAYPQLFAVLGYLYGKQESATGGDNLFRIPDYRGLFLRGVDDGADKDPDVRSRTGPPGADAVIGGVGSLEQDALQTHTHPYDATSASAISSAGPTAAAPPAGKSNTGDPNTPARTSTETRPINVAVNYIIRFR